MAALYGPHRWEQMDRYEIRVAGHLDDRRCRTFEAIEVCRLADGTTSLVVPVRDQAALHGLLTRVRDLGLDLVEVRLVGDIDMEKQP